MKTNFIIYISLLLLLTSCQKREWNNPFDPNCPKELFTPTSFTATQMGDSVVLSWSQSNNQISGFVLQKSAAGGSYIQLAIPEKTMVKVADRSIEGGIKYGYQLYAYAGDNNSNTVTAEIIPLLKATILTSIPTNITYTTAISGGNVINDGGTAIIIRGVCWSTTENPTTTSSKTVDGTGKGSFSSNITGLAAGTTYYVRAYATNNIGTSYGVQVTVTTTAIVPVITTTMVSVVTFNTALSGGNITNNGGATVTTRGVCWSTAHNPTIVNTKTINGTGIGSYTDSIKGLGSNITYYVRAYATNAAGTAYGSEYSIILYMNVADATITDIDGNVYKTVKIGNQIWMAENLKVTKYRDGSAIPNVTDGTIWASLASGAYCDFSNSVANGATYGHLYNYYSIVDNRQLSPTGWHVPTDSEWTILLNYLGGGKSAGAALKETSTMHWISPNTGTNSSGFTAFAGSWRGGDGVFYYGPTIVGYWWSSTSYNSNYSYFIGIASDNNSVIYSSDSYFTKQAGCSIRCTKD